MWLDDLSVSEFKFGLANPLHQGHPHNHIKWVGLFAPSSPFNKHHHFLPLCTGHFAGVSGNGNDFWEGVRERKQEWIIPLLKVGNRKGIEKIRSQNSGLGRSIF